MQVSNNDEDLPNQDTVQGSYYTGQPNIIQHELQPRTNE
jgi:hypothetical protein